MIACACSICRIEGRERRADPRVEGLPLCQVCALEALWQSKTEPPVHVPLINPAAASDMQRHAFGAAQ
jgi:hypothetical protein